MLRITDFGERVAEDEETGATIYEMAINNGFRNHVSAKRIHELDDTQKQELVNSVAMDLTRSWNDHIYGEILESLNILKSAINENCNLVDSEASNKLDDAFNNVLQLCQIQPPEEA